MCDWNIGLLFGPSLDVLNRKGRRKTEEYMDRH